MNISRKSQGRGDRHSAARVRTLGFIPDPKNKGRQSKNGVEVNKFR